MCFCMQLVKAGLVLGLFGGSHKYVNDKVSCLDYNNHQLSSMCDLLKASISFYAYKELIIKQHDLELWGVLTL